MQQANGADDELSRQLSAWEAEGDGQLAMWSDNGRPQAGGLSCDASAMGNPFLVGLDACHPTASLQNLAMGNPFLVGLNDCHPTASMQNLAVIGNGDDIYETVNYKADVFASYEGWPEKISQYEEVDSASDTEDLSIMTEVSDEKETNENTRPTGNNVFPSPGGRCVPADDKASVRASVEPVRGAAVSGPRLALHQGMRRLLERACNTRIAVRRGVRRIREIVGLAYRNARYNNGLTGRDKDACEPLLADDDYTEQEDSGRRSLNEFLEADKRLFR